MSCNLIMPVSCSAINKKEELMNPKFCIRIVSDLYQWDKIGTKLGQCVFCAIMHRKLTFSIGCSRYQFNLSTEAPKDVLACSWFME